MTWIWLPPSGMPPMSMTVFSLCDSRDTILYCLAMCIADSTPGSEVNISAVSGRSSPIAPMTVRSTPREMLAFSPAVSSLFTTAPICSSVTSSSHYDNHCFSPLTLSCFFNAQTKIFHSRFPNRCSRANNPAYRNWRWGARSRPVPASAGTSPSHCRCWKPTKLPNDGNVFQTPAWSNPSVICFMPRWFNSKVFFTKSTSRKAATAAACATLLTLNGWRTRFIMSATCSSANA